MAQFVKREGDNQILPAFKPIAASGDQVVAAGFGDVVFVLRWPAGLMELRSA